MFPLSKQFKNGRENNIEKNQFYLDTTISFKLMALIHATKANLIMNYVKIKPEFHNQLFHR